MGFELFNRFTGFPVMVFLSGVNTWGKWKDIIRLYLPFWRNPFLFELQ